MRIADRGPWKGTATGLRGEIDRVLLEEIPIEEGERYRQIPRHPSQLSQALRRIVPNLRQVGVDIEIGQSPGDNSTRFISVTKSCGEFDRATQARDEVCTQKE
jgi:hypothetical protein